ncbi:MAG: hypothetical protein HY582_01820, partial [Candidatus Omnitrophica bacterium]|nr:hypothetical protein [Candidatus Omnitrophota bacterium]
FAITKFIVAKSQLRNLQFIGAMYQKPQTKPQSVNFRTSSARQNRSELRTLGLDWENLQWDPSWIQEIANSREVSTTAIEAAIVRAVRVAIRKRLDHAVLFRKSQNAVSLGIGDETNFLNVRGTTNKIVLKIPHKPISAGAEQQRRSELRYDSLTEEMVNAIASLEFHLDKASGIFSDMDYSYGKSMIVAMIVLLRPPMIEKAQDPSQLIASRLNELPYHELTLKQKVKAFLDVYVSSALGSRSSFFKFKDDFESNMPEIRGFFQRRRAGKALEELKEIERIFNSQSSFWKRVPSDHPLRAPRPRIQVVRPASRRPSTKSAQADPKRKLEGRSELRVDNPEDTKSQLHTAKANLVLSLAFVVGKFLVAHTQDQIDRHQKRLDNTAETNLPLLEELFGELRANPSPYINDMAGISVEELITRLDGIIKSARAELRRGSIDRAGDGANFEIEKFQATLRKLPAPWRSVLAWISAPAKKYADPAFDGAARWQAGFRLRAILARFLLERLSISIPDALKAEPVAPEKIDRRNESYQESISTRDQYEPGLFLVTIGQALTRSELRTKDERKKPLPGRWDHEIHSSQAPEPMSPGMIREYTARTLELVRAHPAVGGMVSTIPGDRTKPETGKRSELRESIPHDYAKGPLAVADLVREYEALARDEQEAVSQVLVEGRVDNQWVPMLIPVPRAENPEIVKDYLVARVFNVLIVTGPSALKLRGPPRLGETLEAVKKTLLESPKGYTVELNVLKYLHDLPRNLEFPIEITSESMTPKLESYLKQPPIQPVPTRDVKTYLEQIEEIEGIAIGVDIGGTDVKLAVMEQGTTEPVLLKEHVWEVKENWLITLIRFVLAKLYILKAKSEGRKPENMKEGIEFEKTLITLIRFTLAKLAVDKSVDNKRLRARGQRLTDNKEARLEELQEFTNKVQAIEGLKLPAPSSVGISFPDVVDHNEILGGLTSKTKALRMTYHPEGKDEDSPEYRAVFNEFIRPLARRIASALQSELALEKPVPTAVTNDGNIGALWAAVVLKQAGLFSIATGTSLGGGYLDLNAQFPTRMYELGYLVAYLGDKSREHKHRAYDIYGSGQQLLSQDTVFIEAEKAEMMIEGKSVKAYLKENGKAKTLEKIQALFEDPEQKEKVERVFNQLGEYLAQILAATYYGTLSDRYQMVTLFGRPASGKTGEILIKRAKDVLAESALELKNLQIKRASEVAADAGLQTASIERLDKLAQAIGTAYLANAERVKERSELRVEKPIEGKATTERRKFLKAAELAEKEQKTKVILAQNIASRKAPGTEESTNEEEVFYADTSQRLRLRLDGKASPLIDLPINVLDKMKEFFPLGEDSRSHVAREEALRKFVAGEAERGPYTFNEQISLMLHLGLVQLQIDDLDDPNFLQEEATEFHQLQLNLSEKNSDPYLYPRVKSSRNPMGFMSYLTIEQVEKKDGRGAIIYRDGKNQGEWTPAPGDWKVLIHISKKLWEEMGSEDHKTKLKKPEFLTQLVVTQLMEGFMGSHEQMSKHRYASVIGLSLSSEEAIKKGVSDVDQWYLDHATDAYLELLETEYRDDQDTTLGAFAKQLWEVVSRRQKEGYQPRRKAPLEAWSKHLGGDLSVKRAYLTSELTAEQRAWLPFVFTTKQPNPQSKVSIPAVQVPDTVIDWIKRRNIGNVYDKLIDLISAPADENERIVFQVDDVSGNEGYSYNHRASLAAGKYFYPLPEYQGERKPNILFFVAQETDATGKPVGPIIIHLTKKTWNKVWKNNVSEEKPAFLAQVLAYVYLQNFLPQPKNFDKDSWAALNVLRFATKRAQARWITDLNLFILDYAVEKRNIRYLYDLLWNYRMTRDTQGNFRRELFDAMNRLYILDSGNGPESTTTNEGLFVGAIQSPKDLAAYYSYLFEEFFARLPLDQRLIAVAEKLERAAGMHGSTTYSPIVEENIKPANNEYLYKDKMVVNEKTGEPEEQKTVYYLQSIYAWLRLVANVTPVENFIISNRELVELGQLAAVLKEHQRTLATLNQSKQEAEEKLEDFIINAKPEDEIRRLEEKNRDLVERLNAIRDVISAIQDQMNKLWGGSFPLAIGEKLTRAVETADLTGTGLKLRARDIDGLRLTEEDKREVDNLTKQAGLWKKNQEKLLIGPMIKRDVLIDEYDDPKTTPKRLTQLADEIEIIERNVKKKLGEQMEALKKDLNTALKNELAKPPVLQNPAFVVDVRKRIAVLEQEKWEYNPTNKLMNKVPAAVEMITERIESLHKEIAATWDLPFAEWVQRQARRKKNEDEAGTFVFGIYGGPGTGKTTGTSVMRERLALGFHDMGWDYNDEITKSKELDPANIVVVQVLKEQLEKMEVAPQLIAEILNGLPKVAHQLSLPNADSITLKTFGSFMFDQTSAFQGIYPEKAHRELILEALMEWEPMGLHVSYLSTDLSLKPGNVRYKPTKQGRRTFVEGPPIYNDAEIERILRGISEGNEVLAPQDPHAPRGPFGHVMTTFTEEARRGRRWIMGRALDILIMDLTVFGLSHRFAKRLHQLYPAVFENDLDRQDRRLYRDYIPKWAGGSRGDPKNYVRGDMAQKQIQEGRWYQIPMILDFLNRGPVYVWLHDSNKLVKVTPKERPGRSELRLSPFDSSTVPTTINNSKWKVGMDVTSDPHSTDLTLDEVTSTQSLKLIASRAELPPSRNSRMEAWGLLDPLTPPTLSSARAELRSAFVEVVGTSVLGWTLAVGWVFVVYKTYLWNRRVEKWYQKVKFMLTKRSIFFPRSNWPLLQKGENQSALRHDQLIKLAIAKLIRFSFRKGTVERRMALLADILEKLHEQSYQLYGIDWGKADLARLVRRAEQFYGYYKVELRLQPDSSYVPLIRFWAKNQIDILSDDLEEDRGSTAQGEPKRSELRKMVNQEEVDAAIHRMYDQYLRAFASSIDHQTEPAFISTLTPEDVARAIASNHGVTGEQLVVTPEQLTSGIIDFRTTLHHPSQSADESASRSELRSQDADKKDQSLQIIDGGLILPISMRIAAGPRQQPSKILFTALNDPRFSNLDLKGTHRSVVAYEWWDLRKPTNIQMLLDGPDQSFVFRIATKSAMDPLLPLRAAVLLQKLIEEKNFGEIEQAGGRGYFVNVSALLKEVFELPETELLKQLGLSLSSLEKQRLAQVSDTSDLLEVDADALVPYDEMLRGLIGSGQHDPEDLESNYLERIRFVNKTIDT